MKIITFALAIAISVAGGLIGLYGFNSYMAYRDSAANEKAMHHEAVLSEMTQTADHAKIEQLEKELEICQYRLAVLQDEKIADQTRQLKVLRGLANER
jgi:hypothetical protein